jgi:hypothetical protein
MTNFHARYEGILSYWADKEKPPDGPTSCLQYTPLTTYAQQTYSLEMIVT